ncbi:hypothetical protein PRCB_11415 [Pantoea rodasii]|uniref:Uncharacterized protein n=1 Tax=Pantoea rodasii TaxID=1076549 RepID=A0A2M9WCL5_9GAMM|nr:hypothetical protein HA45_16745 [Pantoea rodasii]PJZ05293.1 hypothetical protein PRCB_11415 [Pantoea rodasii]
MYAISLSLKGKKTFTQETSSGSLRGYHLKYDGYIKASGLPLYYRAIVYKLPKRQQMGILR